MAVSRSDFIKATYVLDYLARYGHEILIGPREVVGQVNRRRAENEKFKTRKIEFRKEI